MLFNKNKFLLSSLSIVPILTTTSLIVSCSTIPFDDPSLTDQNNELSSLAAKNFYINTWAEQTYASYFIKTVLQTTITQEKFDAILTFINDLNTRTVVDFQSTVMITSDAVYDKIYNSFFETYKNYTGYETGKDSSFFSNLFLGTGSMPEGEEANSWANLNLFAYNPTTKQLVETDTTVAAHFGIVPWLENYQYIVVPSGSSPSIDITTHNTKFETDFKNLYWIPKTEIQTKMIEMNLTNLYFTTATEEFIKGGTKFNQTTDGLITSSIEAWQATNFNVSDPNYFFLKYLVDKTPVLKWNISTENTDEIQEISSVLPNGVFNTKNYQDIIQKLTNSSVLKELNDNLIFATNDSIFNAIISQMKGFISDNFTSTIETKSGDLNFDRNQLINIQQEKSGFVNQFNTGNVNNTNNLLSFDQLAATNQIKTSLETIGLPSITIKGVSTSKNSFQITPEDLIINSNNDNDIVVKIVPDFSLTGTEQAINVLMTKKLQMVEGITRTYNYDVRITWSLAASAADANIISDLAVAKPNMKDLRPSDKYSLSGINPISSDSTKFDLNYYVRLIPNFKFERVGAPDSAIAVVRPGTQLLPKGKFSLEGITWGTTKEIEKLANLFYLQDTKLFSEVKQAFVWNDYAFSATDDFLIPIFDELGISKLNSSKREEFKLGTPFFVPFISTTPTSNIISQKLIKASNQIQFFKGLTINDDKRRK